MKNPVEVENSVDNLLGVPRELWIQIMKLLDPLSLYRMVFVCKQLNALVKDTHFEHMFREGQNIHKQQYIKNSLKPIAESADIKDITKTLDRTNLSSSESKKKLFLDLIKVDIKNKDNNNQRSQSLNTAELRVLGFMSNSDAKKLNKELKKEMEKLRRSHSIN